MNTSRGFRSLRGNTHHNRMTAIFIDNIHTHYTEHNTDDINTTLPNHLKIDGA